MNNRPIGISFAYCLPAILKCPLQEEDAGWRALTVHGAEGARFPGWWVRYGDFVLTIATSQPAPPPASIRRPPPLATATPGHTWMEDPLQRGE